MATTILSCKPQTITVSGTSDNEINFDSMLAKGDNYGLAAITIITGTAVKFNAFGTVDDTNSSSYTAGDKELIEIQRGHTLHYKGGAGSETFKISIISQ